MASNSSKEKNEKKIPNGPDGDVAYLYEAIQEMAVSYKFKPGERLNERALAQQLGVSRTPLREALNRLSAEGFLDFEAGRGFSCRPLEPKQVMDLYGLRAALERESVRLAVDHATEEDIAELEDFLRKPAQLSMIGTARNY